MGRIYSTTLREIIGKVRCRYGLQGRLRRIGLMRVRIFEGECKKCIGVWKYLNGVTRRAFRAPLVFCVVYFLQNKSWLLVKYPRARGVHAAYSVRRARKRLSIDVWIPRPNLEIRQQWGTCLAPPVEISLFTTRGHAAIQHSTVQCSTVQHTMNSMQSNQASVLHKCYCATLLHTTLQCTAVQ